MRRFQWKNRLLRKRLTKTKERTVEMIFLLNAATLQQMNEEKKKEKKNTIDADEKSAKMNMKKLVKKNSRRRKRTLDIRYSKISSWRIQMCEFQRNITLMTQRRFRTSSKTSYSNSRIFQKKEAMCKRDKWMNFFSLFKVYINRF